MFRVVSIHAHTNVEGNIVKYSCTSEDDIPKLPRFGIRGTQNDCLDKENNPCGYDSKAILYTDTSTKLFVLRVTNEWKEVK